MRIDLIDRDGDPSSVWILDPITPELTDELGCPALDMASHPAFPQPYGPILSSDHPVKRVMDSFFMRPAPALHFVWLDHPDSKAYQIHYELLDLAMWMMLGKRITGVTK